LRNSTQYLSSLWQSFPQAAAVLDADQMILAWNRRAEDLLGLPTQDVIGRPITELPLQVAGTENGIATWLATATENEVLTPTDAVVRSRDNRLQRVTISGSPVIADEATIGTVLVFSDPPGSSRSEQALRNRIAELERQASRRQLSLTQAEAKLQLEADRHTQAEAALMIRNRELLSLQSAVAATASSLDLPFVLETMTWEIADLLDVESCTVYEWHMAENTITTMSDYAALVSASPMVKRNLDLSTLPVHRRTLEGKYAQPLRLPVESLPTDGQEQTALSGQGILLPMVFQDSVVGLIEAVATNTDRQFSDREISVGQLLANQAAVTIEHARLYDRAQREIAERVCVEQRMKDSIKEKETLLQEIHHRVKNNLQVISSLLNLQARTVEDPKTIEVLQESRNRLRSMALIHERLYRSDNLAQVDFGEYLRGLTSYLVRSYRAAVGAVALRLDVSDVSLTIERAVPCGLIVNELVSNALKYAFPDGRRGQITVSLHQVDASVYLAVADDGVGLPKDLEIDALDSLGLQLVHMLTEQLNGRIDLDRECGTKFAVVFPGSKGA
jgi:PAS domain S-box-containing protein